MKTMPNELPHIPVEYVAGVARTKKTDGQRKPYVDLIKQWAEHKADPMTGITKEVADKVISLLSEKSDFRTT